MAKSPTQRQLEYRDRLRSKDPELLRALDHEKYRRRCLKSRANVSVRRINQADSHFIDVPHRDLELRQHDNINKSSSWKVYPIEERTYNKHDENRTMMEQIVENRLRNAAFDENVRSTESSVSVKYPIHGLLKWLENVNDDDEVKYGFLKYIYGEKASPDECNSADAKGQSDKNHVPSQHSNERKRIRSESSSESAMSDIAKDQRHEKTERTVTRTHKKSAKKMRRKRISKKATKRRNVVITWEPLCFDDDESQENYK